MKFSLPILLQSAVVKRSVSEFGTLVLCVRMRHFVRFSSSSGFASTTHSFLNTSQTISTAPKHFHTCALVSSYFTHVSPKYFLCRPKATHSCDMCRLSAVPPPPLAVPQFVCVLIANVCMSLLHRRRDIVIPRK